MKFLTLVSTAATAQEISPPAGPTRPATNAPEKPKFLRAEPKIYPRFSTSSPTKRVIETLITPASYKPYTQEEKKEEKKPMDIHVDPIPEEEKKQVFEGLTEVAEEKNEEVESTTEVKAYEASSEAAEEQEEEKEEKKPMDIHVDPIPEEEKKEVFEASTEAAEEQDEEVESTREVKAYEASTEAAEEQDEEVESITEVEAYEASTEAAQEQDEEKKETTTEGESKEKEKKDAAESKDSGSYLVCTYFAALAVIAMF